MNRTNLVRIFVFSLLGLVLGWFLGISYSGSRSDDSRSEGKIESSESESDRAAAPQRIRELEEELATKEAALLSAQSELDAFRKASAEPRPTEIEEEGVGGDNFLNPFIANAQSMALTTLKTQKKEELEKLKVTLTLTPEQVAELEAFYEAETERETLAMERVFAGESIGSIHSETLAENGNHRSLSELLNEILTPEQQEIYEANQKEEALERKEADAYRQLGNMQSEILLNEVQKDLLFEIFYDKNYALSPEDWKAHGLEADDPEFILKSQAIENEQLLEELSKALTPEQLERYRRKLENQREMIRKSLEMFAPK